MKREHADELDAAEDDVDLGLAARRGPERQPVEAPAASAAPSGRGSARSRDSSASHVDADAVAARGPGLDRQHEAVRADEEQRVVGPDGGRRPGSWSSSGATHSGPAPTVRRVEAVHERAMASIVSTIFPRRQRRLQRTDRAARCRLDHRRQGLFASDRDDLVDQALRRAQRRGDRCRDSAGEVAVDVQRHQALHRGDQLVDLRRRSWPRRCPAGPSRPSACACSGGRRGVRGLVGQPGDAVVDRAAAAGRGRRAAPTIWSSDSVTNFGAPPRPTAARMSVSSNRPNSLGSSASTPLRNLSGSNFWSGAAADQVVDVAADGAERARQPADRQVRPDEPARALSVPCAERRSPRRLQRQKHLRVGVLAAETVVQIGLRVRHRDSSGVGGQMAHGRDDDVGVDEDRRRGRDHRGCPARR